LTPKKKNIVPVYTLFVLSTVFVVFLGFLGQSSRFEFIVPVSKFTLLIALEGKNSVFVAASVPWSQFMVPKREK